MIHQKNGGVSAARNKGLDFLNEEYVMFVDADDYVEKEYVYDLYHGMIDHNTDLSITLGLDEDEKGNLTHPWNEHDESRQMNVDDYDWNGSEQHPIVWGALFKRDLIGDIRFDSKYYVGEDSLFFAEYLKNVKKLYYVHKPLYHYVHYSQSAAFGKFDNKKITELYAWKKICEEYAYRYDIAAAYAIRCKGFCMKYYFDSDFYDHYLNGIIKAYQSNFKSLMKVCTQKKWKRSTISNILFYFFPKVFCRIKAG